MVRRFHFGSGDVTGEGVFQVWRSSARLGRVLGTFLRLPPPSDAVRVSLTIRRPPAEPPTEWWFPRFGTHRMDTVLTSDRDSLVERAGRTELRFGVTVAGDRLCFVHTGTRRRWGRWWLPVPRRLAPRVEASVGPSPDQRRLRVEVQVSALGVGPLLRYGGHLDQVEP